ncbi:uncharacterized protein YjgD (DUF1641 family) [Cytobacillus horneckiae]|uniref:DUF1641 domain-containing protein n=1 Tax=Cytobacillus horneckiae TaxID=549687 RepID=A0A2N0ZJ90_9BACI|nr:DUF1641 domain-containing protein [Cytobacillus horneckiae]MBN6888485.1 DUF1641 domain-containing protein [Cytobacillus horneckiae]MEC1156473.1 DUF1641 domain-containing protein [Cytobacillus horneckiae]MED2938490.1 DUF1641 domain-containing protein [Cytobacillus horneckiae]PKG29536.1 DUF1641 domain-containing protein [Cytobacillus horneckiae]
MAAPITEIYREIDEEKIKQQKIDELKTLVSENEDTINNLFKILGELNDSGILQATNSMLKGKEEIAKIALGQVSREPVTNLINTLMGATAALMEADAEQTTKLIKSAMSGIDEGKSFLESEHKIGVMNLVKVLNDPDINRAIGFGIHFLRGMGKGLKEDK